LKKSSNRYWTLLIWKSYEFVHECRASVNHNHFTNLFEQNRQINQTTPPIWKSYSYTRVHLKKKIMFLPQFFLGHDLHFSFGTHISRGSDLQRGTTSLWHSCRGVCVQVLRGSSWHDFSYLTLMAGTTAFTWWPLKPEY
jgi:hypothetical protein